MKRPLVLVAALAIAATSCSSSGGSATAPSSSVTAASSTPVATVTTAAAVSSTTAAPAITTTAAATTTTAAPTTTTVAAKITPSTCPPVALATMACETIAVPLDRAKPAGPTINLAVTIRRVNPSSWTSPVLFLANMDPEVAWTESVMKLWGPDSFVGHDLIALDARGVGRSDGAVICTELHDFTAELNTFALLPPAVATMKACMAKSSNGVTLASILDHEAGAADIVAIRKALGIDKWSLYSSVGSTDVAMHLLQRDSAAVTSVIARDPMTVGNASSLNDTAAAFDRLAADCAAAPECGKLGDVKVALAKTLARLKTPKTVQKKEEKTGAAIVLDDLTIAFAVRAALTLDPFTALLPQILTAADPVANDELIAGFLATSPAADEPRVYARFCQDLGFGRPPLTPRNDDKAGIFAGQSYKRFCDQIGPVPQMTAPPKVTSDIQTLVILSSYDPGSSVDNAKAIFAGFSHTTIVTVPGLPYAAAKQPCYFQATTAFLNSPTTAPDTKCLTTPDMVTFK